jgi:HEAT repeat protein
MLEPLSFGVGFLSGILFLWLLSRFRPLWRQWRETAREQRQAAQMKRSSGVEDNHRRVTLRRAQGMHLAASLFSLDEILQEPRLIAPPVSVEPGVISTPEDIISQTLPYMPAWPELAAIYNAPTLSLTEALSGGSNLVIVGAAGAGKTVALAHLASLAANFKVKLDSDLEAVPYLYHVADLQLPFDASKDPASVIINIASENAPMLDLRRLPGFIQQTFRDGQALVLIDGFDELDPHSQTGVVDWFKALLNAYPNVRIVTTAAVNQTHGLASLGFSPLALIAWDAKTNSHFIQQWGELWSRTVALETSTPSSEPNQVDPLVLNSWLMTDNRGLTPLELTLKVWGAYAGDSLGPRVLDAIATHVRRLAPSGTPVAALELLAMQVVLTCQPIFDPRTARSWVKQYDIVDDLAVQGAEAVTITSDSTSPALTDSQKIRIKKSRAGEAAPTYGLLSKMVESGLLVQHQHNRMRFLHPVLNGYLSGQAIGDNDADTTLLALPECDVRNLSLHYLAARGDAGAVADILLKESDIPLHAPAFLVAGWLRDAPREAPWRAKVFNALLNILQAEGQPSTLRAQAMAAFVTSRDPGAATLFRQLLGSRSYELLPLAALGSGALRDAKAQDLLEEILQAPNGAVRRATCLALVALGSEQSLEAVARALLQGDEELRRAAAEALANDPVEGSAMLKEGATMADIMVRRAVAHGLARVDEPWSAETLQRMQLEDDQWAVRNLATQYLEQKAHLDPRVPRRLKVPSETPWLIEYAGKQGMGIPSGGPATDVLVDAYKHGDTEQRLAALPYLKRIADEGIIGALYNGMYGEDPEVREASFYAIEEIAANGVRIPHPTQFGLG